MQLGLTSQQLVDCSQDCRPYSHHRGLIQDLPRRRHVARSSKSPISGSAPAAFAPVDSSGHSRNQCYSTTMTQAVPRQRAWLPRYSTISRLSKSLLVALLIAMHAVSPAHAVRIPFTNCLSDAYRLHEPTRLQWVPLYADAVFDTENEKHNLRVIVWGNVTGARTTSALPPPDDPSWKDASDINGKIAETPQKKDGYNTATTYFPKVHFLTYVPYNNDKFNFCNTSLVNGSCPLGPYFGEVDYSDAYKLPSINITWDAYSTYAFASLAPSMSIIDGTRDAPQIGCVSMAVTPDLGGLSWLLKFLPMIVLLFTGFAVVFSAIFSPWGSSDIFHWTSNYGRDVDLLRLVTPGFGDCLQYIQFIALSGGLTLDYPGFYQPIVSQMAWSTLMFNESFVADAPSWQSVVDGIYVTNATYGLQELGQLVGMAESRDIWAGMMVWLCVCIASVTALVQGAFAVQWLFRKINNTPEEDLRSKNVPFSVGNAVRIVFNYFLFPIIALSCFQLVTAGDSPTYTIALAVVTLVFLIIFAVYLFYLIIRTRPKSVLYDDLPTVLLYGPLYNTYSDEAAGFALIPVFLTFLRGITVGAVQPSGIAQVVLLAICEVIHILTIHAFRPFQRSTAMNAYHTLFGALRLISILLMVAFVPTLDVSEGDKGWIGYIILGIHGAALIFGFFLNALQTIIEVAARMLGAGGDDARGLTRGGLTKIFGMRQLSRRNTQQRNTGPSRASQLSTAAMLDVDDSGKSGYAMPSGRVRSESGASLGGLMNPRHRSSSALDSIDVYSGMPQNVDSSSSYMPNTPGERSTFSFLPSPSAARHHHTQSIDAADPYYRPPRRRQTMNESIHSEGPGGSNAADVKGANPAGGLGDPADMGADISRGATPAPPPAGYSQASIPPNRPDYATREVDFYYGVRGPALNSDGPGRKLGTGPADPTGPVATASGWFRNLFGGKTKEKGKGFEVVRSSRMPPAMMARNGGESPPEGIPVAMGVLRNGPIDSDDEDEPRPRRSPGRQPQSALLDDNGDPQDSEPESPVLERPRRTFSAGSESFPREPSKSLSKAPHIALREAEDDDAPEIPRKSSKRASGHFGGSDHSRAPSLTLMNMPGSTISFESQWRGEPDAVSRTSSHHRATLSASSRLPFERTNSQKRLSSNSSMEFPGEFTNIDFGPSVDERPASFGMVSQHGVSRVDPLHRDVDLLGSSAELVEDPPARPRT
ncbi:hypothetical protein NW761_014714 [Fusarium oxysporum]|nr:hypothetical protein NW758_014137 [Fusarium oxysporum]KAJ4072652.1 hypothetical protein NW761_014714 [Fusarium oxysporum]KAJ4119198.1 hypothetical protein NW769_001800 [Fusarium oxysporum]KAJ4221174.1 hypothetical protein NW760_011526 [Fusarium oxysporum]